MSVGITKERPTETLPQLVLPWGFRVRPQRTCAGSPIRTAFHAQPFIENVRQEAEAIRVGTIFQRGTHAFSRGVRMDFGPLHVE